jgi:hypothetical protein
MRSWLGSTRFCVVSTAECKLQWLWEESLIDEDQIDSTRDRFINMSIQHNRLNNNSAQYNRTKNNNIISILLSSYSSQHTTNLILDQVISQVSLPILTLNINILKVLKFLRMR